MNFENAKYKGHTKYPEYFNIQKNSNDIRYYRSMIKSFATKETAAIFVHERAKGLPTEIIRIAQRKLLQLHNIMEIEELRVPPGNRLEKPSGNREGQWSIRINAQWRICFTFENGDVFDVEIVDYH